jgi:hypothetical protein
MNSHAAFIGAERPKVKHSSGSDALVTEDGDGPRGCNSRLARLQHEWEMRILFGEQMISDDLIAFLRRSECITERRTQRMLEVSPRQPMLPDAARLEIEGLLRVWHKLHPEVASDVEFVEERRAAPHERAD